jgi:O-antigen ligase
LAALVFYALAAMETPAQQRWTMVWWALFGGGIGFWFVAGHDWVADPSKVRAITVLGMAVQAWLPRVKDPGLNPNAAARMVAALLPLSAGLAVHALRSNLRRRWIWFAWGALTTSCMALALLLSTSRGTWVGVIAGLGLAALWWLVGRWPRGRRLSLYVAMLGLGLVLAAAGVAFVSPLRSTLSQSEAISHRLKIFSQAALLVRDYPFTGAGLGEFPLVHSTYALLMHVPSLPHGHSVLIDIALSQGVLGAVAAVCVIGGAAWLGLYTLDRVRPPPPALVPGLISLAIISIAALVDDTFYISWGMLLLWVPAGIVVAGWRAACATYGQALRPKAWRWQTLVSAAVVVLVLIAAFWRPLAAAWYANLGAVRQTWTELSQYDFHHFGNPTLDQVRERSDLSAAEGSFGRALSLEPGQVTARTRLAQIALGRRSYDEALHHAQAAWEAGHRDPVTRLLLGDALVATGDVEGGVEVVRGFGSAAERLHGQGWARYWLGEDYVRAADAWRAALLLDPGNEWLIGAIKVAEERAEEK